MKALFIFLLLSIVSAFSQDMLEIQSVSEHGAIKNFAIARWTPSPSPDVKNYTLYHRYGIADEQYQETVDDTTITIQLNRFSSGIHFENIRFHVTATDHSGNESESSNVVFKLFAKTVTLQGDYNQDGSVLADDIMRMYGALGSEHGNIDFWGTADVNGDGVVLADDMMISRGNLGKSIL